MAGLKEFYCGSNEPCHASLFKWLEYTFKPHASFCGITGFLDCTNILEALWLWPPGEQLAALYVYDRQRSLLLRKDLSEIR